MGAKKKVKGKSGGKARVKKPAKKQSGKPGLSRRYQNYILLIILCLVTWFAYSDSPNNGYTNWDDHTYVTQNEDLSPLSEKLSVLLSSDYSGNYHPLTMLSLAIDKAIDDNPRSFHITSLIIHILNVLLVYLLVNLLFGNSWLAFFVALLFGIHPMHVESVAWISARKDVLYSMFFLAGMICYVRYLDKKSWLFWTLALLAGALAGLSKPAAVVYPLIIILIAHLKEEPLRRELLRSIPFFLIAAAVAWLNFNAQESAGAVAEDMSLGERLLTALFGLGFYVEKAFIPLSLSTFHPFPKGNLNSSFWINVFLGTSIAGLGIWSFFKDKTKLFFSIGIYCISLILVLQLIPFGSAIVAERYSYMAYLGLFLLILIILDGLISKGSIKWAMLSMVSIPLLFATRERVKIWENSETLWTDALKTYPLANKALNNRGTYYLDNDFHDLALKDFEKLIATSPSTQKAHYNRATVHYNLGNYDASLGDYLEARRREPGSPDNLYGLGNVYNRRRVFDSAMYYYDQVLNINPQHYRALGNKASIYFQKGDYENSLIYYDKVLQLNQDDLIVFKNKGATLLQLGRYKEAIEVLNHYLASSPSSADAHYYLAICHEKLGNYDQALSEAQRASGLGMGNIGSYIESLKAQIGK